jgi:hypothetical protein
MRSLKKITLLATIFFLIRIPNTLASGDVRMRYGATTVFTKNSVDVFFEQYGRAVVLRLAPIGAEKSRLVAEELQQAIRFEYMNRSEEAYAIEIKNYEMYPHLSILQARMAYVFYARGMIARKSSPSQSAGYFKTSVEFAKNCVKQYPNDGECWLFYGASLGRYSVAVGIFETLSRIEEVHDAFEKAARLTRKDPFPFGPHGFNSSQAALMGLIEFYRVCPDWWLMEVIANIRGNKKKAYELSAGIDPVDFDRAEVKVRAVLCYGAVSKNQKIIDEGTLIIRQAAHYELVQPLHFISRENILYLDNFLTHHKSLGMSDYYKIGCEGIERPTGM